MDNNRTTIRISRKIYENRLWKIFKSINKIEHIKQKNTKILLKRNKERNANQMGKFKKLKQV